MQSQSIAPVSATIALGMLQVSAASNGHEFSNGHEKAIDTTPLGIAVKKYLLILIPLAMGYGYNAYVQMVGPDPENPYKAYQADVDYFGGIAIIAGGTFAAVMLICMLIYDFTGLIDNRATRRNMQKYTDPERKESK